MQRRRRGRRLNPLFDHDPMQIRSFSPDDVDALRAVFRSSVHELARPFYTPEQLQAMPDEHVRRVGGVVLILGLVSLYFVRG